MAAVPILSGDEWDNSMSVEGHRSVDGEDMQAFMNALSPGYFKTMKIPILEGRDFQRADFKENSRVAIVNRKFAEHFFKGGSAVGKRIGNGVGPKAKLNIEIIGVVADSLYEGPREGVRRQVFIPHFGSGSAALYVRTTIPSSAAYSLIRNEVKQQDAAMPVYEMKTLEKQLDETLLTDRLIALLSAGFGFLATVLASVGLYGVMAFVVARRRKELGIRLALGAQPGIVIWMVMREVLLLLSIGLAVGIPAALLLGRYVSSQLYGIDASDPLIAVLDDAPAGAGVRGRRADSSASREPDRSDPGLADGVDHHRDRERLRPRTTQFTAQIVSARHAAGAPLGAERNRGHGSARQSEICRRTDPRPRPSSLAPRPGCRPPADHAVPPVSAVAAVVDPSVIFSRQSRSRATSAGRR